MSTREERVALAAAHALGDVEETPGAVLVRVPEAPDSPMLNRIVGLGTEHPATEGEIDDALAAMGSGVTFYVAVSPGAQPAELPGWLQARGLEPGWGWMAFRRGVEAPPEAHSELRLVEVADDDAAAAFARIVRISYGLPAAVEAAVARAPARGWQCWLALDGDEPAGAAGLLVADGAGYLGYAGTLDAHRGKGAQSALLRARIERAAELGCDMLITETGERRDDLPSNSYRNILRAGFEEVAVTAHWVSRRPDAG
ncbi:MAG: GNAT family N-acetyltransferase [Solirubrobacteraceae bacterium]